MRGLFVLAIVGGFVAAESVLGQPPGGGDPPLPPGPNDVKVEWTSGYPKKEDGKLKMKGTVTFANGWSSANGKVTVTINPVGGGVATIKLANITNGAWETEEPLTTFPMPKKMYDITPSVSAWKGEGTPVYVVTGERKNLELP